ncbi:hypothetical protein [Rhizobium sp. SL86]|uniref:hypothetical protein n=1 Tax=Rhizobium sp. SL86 TaxID=2995148 RepID=UPI00227681C2|nr:hypothetical protein [Rhizobium sp. SL86]MCY1667691.1 hypothetical protein [Rhizobium sp. SL86]
MSKTDNVVILAVFRKMRESALGGRFNVIELAPPRMKAKKPDTLQPKGPVPEGH